MPKKSDRELKTILQAAKQEALASMNVAGTSGASLSRQRTEALNYYYGDMADDMPAAEGRSRAVSTDVADTVEGLLPTLLEIFTAGDEVAHFSAVGPEDEPAAAQETDYVNHVFMQQNPGFMVLYSMIKDALLSKTGIVKVFWDEEEREERETYLDLDDAAFSLIVGNPDIEIIEHTVHQPGEGAQGAAPQPPANAPPGAPGAGATHDVTIGYKRTHAQAKVIPVPPEEFGISRHARTVADTDYCFHEVVRTQHALIAEGFDAKQVKRLPSYQTPGKTEEHARDTVDENNQTRGDAAALNDAARLIRVTEHYIRMDYDGSGRAGLYRITTGGEDGEVLHRDDGEDVIEEDAIPFAAMTPVPVTHRFFGRSVADLVMDIQRIKTALLRGALDNLYMHNNPRPVLNGQVCDETTLDDLLVSRHGGMIRAKGPGAIEWQVVPDITASVYPALQYFDASREWRTGVSRQGQGVDPNALQNQVATIANQMFNAAQAKVKLIARIFAETGIKDLFVLLHGTIRKHGSEPQTVRLRNQWVTVDPRDWKERNDLTINVGLGTGSKAEQLAHAQMIAAVQEKLIPLGLVTPANAHETAKEIVKLGGHKDTDRFLTAPNPQAADQPIPMPTDPRQAEIQAKAAAEQAKMQADQAHQQMRMQLEMQLEQQKFELEKQLKLLDAELKAREHHMAMAQKAAEPGPPGPDGQPSSGNHGAMLGLVLDHLQRANAPKRARKLADGSWVSEQVDQPLS
jgi:hypothetical protein